MNEMVEIPTRTHLRLWLLTLTRDQILACLDIIEHQHGKSVSDDLRHILNQERERAKTGQEILTPAERDLHEEKQKLQENIKQQSRLYR